MMNSSSTLVATVSINYEDFTEGFLTCGTCLCAYDQDEHAPKLLSCSHTICHGCLELIASSPSLSNTTEAGCIKCPICRQNIAIPSGGISALPPSFLVNQLFDLVNKKPREFIPKCSVHLDQELLFCETCDCVFCDTCNNSSETDDSLTTASLSTTTTTATNSSANQPNAANRQQQYSKQHINETCTVIPFSTAIKRISEILSYRSQQCLGRLDEAKVNVQNEIEKLETNRLEAVQDIEAAFERIRKIIEEREKELLDETNRLHDHKKNILLGQLAEIDEEKSSLSTNSCVKVNNETDVKNLSKKISDLTEKNDTALAFFTPRENCLICFENDSGQPMESIRESVNHYGKVRTSKTYPPYCTSKLVHFSTHMRSVAVVQSVDYEESLQRIGGDPIRAELKLVGYNDEINGEIVINDKRDGTYEVSFIPPLPGKYQLYIYLFNRPIKNCPLTFETNSHHNPIAIFGQSSKRGVTDQFDHFSQPASLIINKHNGRVFVMDSFNSRIKVLAQIDSRECPFSFMQHIQPDFFSRSCTGIALLYPEEDDESEEHAIQTLSLSPSKAPNPNILVTDWRNHTIYELNPDGKLLRQYTHEDLQEPTNIVVDGRGRIFVVDREAILVFNSVGKLIHKLTGYKYDGSCRQDDLASLKKSDTLSEMDRHSLATQLQAKRPSQATANLMSTVRSNDNSNKENKTLSSTATLNDYLINNTSSNKQANAKLGTLSSLMSMRRKPKLNPGSSLQRGSKAVISAASRIKSTFTLSHSTSLVSAASLQSMFNNSNKQQQLNSNNPQAISLNEENQDNVGDANATVVKQKNSDNKPEQRQNNETLTSSPTSPMLSEQGAGETQECDIDDDSDAKRKNLVIPFGVIRSIAIGPDDELIVADESRVRVLQPGDEYTFKRELFIQSRLGGHHNSSTIHGGRLCSMTYDQQSKQLLALYTSLNSGGTPFIQIVDYQSGKAKFIIDSHDSKLMRPSCLASYGQHVIVTDLGNDCIKKYRFY